MDFLICIFLNTSDRHKIDIECLDHGELGHKNKIKFQ